MPPHRIRAELQVNGGERVVTLATVLEEKPEHLALKLAAYLSLWDAELLLDGAAKHPAIAGQEFRPDLFGEDAGGDVGVWVECGNTSLNKLTKLVRRWPSARIVVFQEREDQAKRLRAELLEADPRTERYEIYAWPGDGFREWCALLSEKTEVYGECGGASFNLVVNEKVFDRDFARY